MAKFSYRAKKDVHNVVDGVIEAASIQEAVLKITQQGLSPIDVDIFHEKRIKSATPPKFFSPLGWARVSRKQTVVLTRQLYDLLDAGIPLLRALRLLADQQEPGSFKTVLEDVARVVQDGSSLSQGLERHSDIFSPLYINLVRSGENSGHLTIVLGRLADFLERDQETSQKAITSFIYPSLILTVGVITVFILLSFVVPRLTDMFDELSQRLPWPTVFLINLSHIFARFWWLMVIGAVALFFYGQQVYRNPHKRSGIDAQILRLPLIGEFIVKLELVRFAQTLGTLLEGGVSIVDALRSAASVVTNFALRQEADQLADDIAAGTSLAESLKKTTFFPSAAINMVAVGEESGQLEKALYKVSGSYDRQTDQTIRAITSLLEPMLIVLIGSVVGFVVVAMLLPIFQMNLIIQ